MSDVQGVMNFELLPNEILIICFEYLNTFEIFYSFDRLNSRFYKLIRNIQLQLNFENVEKTIFDQFCGTIKSSPEMKNQIYYLQLSNNNTYGQIELFLSFFSLKEFSYLWSLKLIEIEEQNVAKLKSMLPFLSNLFSFHFISQKTVDNEILDTLPMFNLRILSIFSLHSIKTRATETLNITNLTLYTCSLEHLLYHMFKYFPMLKYLNIKNVSRYNHPIEDATIINTYNGVYLKQLIIGLFQYYFEDFQIFVNQIPNLKCLTINAENDIHMINGHKWRNLIQSSLPHLKIFKFNFGCSRKYNSKTILEIFKYFQDDFWCKQHQWYTEYSFEKYSAFIYTIPYALNTYKLEMNTKRFPNTSMNNLNTFDQVTSVILDHEVLRKKYQYYFSNVETLVLRISDQNLYNLQKPICVRCLKMIVNLSNLNHLNILQYERMLTSSLLLGILKQSPLLSQITMNSSHLIELFNDDEICKYLKKMIKKLYIYKHSLPSFNDSNEMEKFCEIFSNIEQLTCSVSQSNDVLFLMNHLSKLSTLNVYLPPLGDHDYFSALFEEESRRLNFIFRVKGMESKAPELAIWIGRKIN